MSAVPSDGSGSPLSPLPLGWQERPGLTITQAENLLDQLEAAGVVQLEAQIGPAGVTVLWRPTWPRLAQG